MAFENRRGKYKEIGKKVPQAYRAYVEETFLPCDAGDARIFVNVELDTETGLYYYGARYLDPKYSRWLSGDPAVGEYIPKAPIDDEAKKHNENLPGLGGVYNTVNLHVYHYAGNNPVKYVDPDGRASEAVGYSGSYTGEPTKAVVDTPSATVAILYMLKTLGKEAWTGIKAVAPYALIPLFIFSLQGDSVKSQAQTDNAKVQAQGNLQAISPSPAPNEPDNDKDKQRTSPNQMNQQVKRGKAPKSVDRVDSANTNVRGEQDHIHFKDGNALNKDDSWKEGLGRSLTNVEKQWIIDNNWAVPMD